MRHPKRKKQRKIELSDGPSGNIFSSLKGIIFQTHFGWGGATVTDEGIRYMFLHEPSQEQVESKMMEKEVTILGNPTTLLEKIISSVKGYFEGEKVKMNFPLDLLGLSPFSQKVLIATQKICYGQTRTYGEVAALAGFARASRAVGTVMARNPLPLIVP